MQNNNIPKIRFNGFTAPWEQRKLTEFVEFFSGLTYTPNDVQKNGTLVLRSSNVSNGEVVDADNVYVNPQVVNSKNVKVGDIVVVVRNGSRSLIGKHAQIKAFMPNTVIGAFMTGIRSECPEFTNALLNTSRFEEEIAMNMGATINQITGYMFSKMEFKVPCLDEQKKIGSYFANLDRLITLHQRKYDKLTNVKKSMLEKLFPKNGASVPKIRFKGFSDAWEQRKLEDVARILGGNAWKASDYSDDGEYLVVTIANVSGEVIINDSVGNRISCDNPDVYLLNKGDILVSLTGNVGRVSKMSNIKGLLNQRVGKILPNNSDINADFLFHVLRNPHFERAMIDAGQGAAQKNIRNDDVLNYAFFLPVEKDEQNIIAHYFNRLDNLITLHQCKLEKLKHIKQACLEQMFL